MNDLDAASCQFGQSDQFFLDVQFTGCRAPAVRANSGPRLLDRGHVAAQCTSMRVPACTLWPSQACPLAGISVPANLLPIQPRRGHGYRCLFCSLSTAARDSCCSCSTKLARVSATTALVRSFAEAGTTSISLDARRFGRASRISGCHSWSSSQNQMPIAPF